MPLPPLAPTDGILDPPDVQRTAFSVDILGRFLCNTLDEALTNPDYDAIVIGAGMYGGYCAAEIFWQGIEAGRPMRVLVLEAGPFILPEHGQNIPNAGIYDPGGTFNTFTADRDQRILDKLVWGIGWRSNVEFNATAYCVGGKSLYWGGWCPRLTADDLAKWPEELRTYLTSKPKFGAAAKARKDVYEAVEYELGAKPTDDFIFDPTKDPNAPKPELGLNEALHHLVDHAIKTRATDDPLREFTPPPMAVQTSSYISGLFSLDKYSSVPLLTAALRAGENYPPIPEDQRNDGNRRMFLVPNTHVRKLVCPPVFKDGAAPESYRVHEIEVVSNGQRRTIPVRPTCQVVLALGAIESTRLALESFPAAPGDRGQERMGRNLMAHVRADLPFFIDRKQLSKRLEKDLKRPLAEAVQSASLHVQGYGDHGRFHFQVYSAATPNNPDGLIYNMIPDPDVGARLEAMESADRIAVIFRICGEMTADPLKPVGADKTSWIDLAGDADYDQAFGHRRAYVHFADPSGLDIWDEMYDAAKKLAESMGGQGVKSKAEFMRDRDKVGSTWHEAGTLFIGDEPRESVCDVNGRFHHISNAACVDQAVFPTVGSANPVLTGTCLARKTAEEIVQRHVSRPDLSSAETVAEKALGYAFLLEGANAQKWKMNDAGRVARPPLLLANGTILEALGGNELGIAFFDDPVPFQDFVLRLQWKAFGQGGDLTANSGVFLRTLRPPSVLDAAFYAQAVEVQIDETGWDFPSRKFRSPLHRTGAIYEVAPARQWAAKAPSIDGTDGLWNDYEIEARGGALTVRLNGKLVSQGSVAGRGGSGFIGVQHHSGKVQFRNIRVLRT